MVDGLQEAGYKLDLVNTVAVKQYDGLTYSNDKQDAFHLAHLLRLGILPTGYIYPKKERAVRDLLRRRLQLVQQRTTHILSIKNQLTRSTGKQFKSNEVIKLTSSSVKQKIKDPNIQEAILINVCVLNVLTSKITSLEKLVLKQVKLKPEFQKLLRVPGIGNILAMTIMLETGDISRFNKVGNYASYCRCVNSKRISNGKQKGRGNRKNGNKYYPGLIWKQQILPFVLIQKQNSIIRKKWLKDAYCGIGSQLVRLIIEFTLKGMLIRLNCKPPQAWSQYLLLNHF